jgi:type IX secretion system PorP/SprF family membrane protein
MMNGRAHIKTVIFTTLGLVVGVGCSMAQQKVQFTQYMFNPLVINPAYAGADGPLALNFINRTQWAGIENAPVTQTLSAHSLFKQEHVGVGLTLVNDKIGVHNNFSVMTNYAYHLRLGAKATVSMGVQGGIHKTTSDYASLMSPNTYDPKLSTSPVRESYFDFGFGFYFRNEKLTAGLSCPELVPKSIRVNDSSSFKLSRTNTFLLGRYRMRATETMEVEPGLLLKYLNGVSVSFDLNVNMIYREVLTAGLSYRKKESIDFLFKARVTPQLQLGYSYDHPIGYMDRISNGSHELMVQYMFQFVKNNVSSPR